MPEYAITIIRSVIAFILLLVMARVMGKKQISHLTFFDYCVGITIGSVAASMAVDQNIKITNGLMALLVWGLFPIILGYLGLKSRTILQLTDGKSDMVIENGKILEKNLKKNQLAVKELMLLLREKGVFNVEDVEMAIFETNGELSILKKSEEQPVTSRILGIPIERDHGPAIVISDGQVMKNSLKKLGYTKEWLLAEIQVQGAGDFQDVFLAQIDSKGNVYADLYQDNLKREKVQQRPLLAASLKKIQADLESFALQTENQEAKQMYTKQAQNLQNILDTISPYLR